MGNELLQVMDRIESPKKARRNGFVPAVIYGEGFEHGMPVKLEQVKLNKALRNHSKTSKYLVKIGEQEKEVLIKEVQRDSLSGQVIHVDMQVLTGNERIRVKIPVIMKGREILEKRNLILEVYSSEIEISGFVNSLPDSVSIDVSERNPGDAITVGDIKITEENVRIHTSPDEVLAVVSVPKQAGDQSDKDEGQEDNEDNNESE